MSADRRIKDHFSKSTVKDGDDDDYSIFMEHRQESVANIEMFRPSSLHSRTIAASEICTQQQQQQQTITSNNKPKKPRPTKKELREYKEKKRDKSIKKNSWLHED